MPSDHATKDHVLPKSKGGGGGPKNLVLSCSGCNSKKGDRLVNPATGQPISPRVLSVFLTEG